MELTPPPKIIELRSIKGNEKSPRRSSH